MGSLDGEQDLKLFKGLIDEANDAIFVIDPGTAKFLDVNKKACDNLKYTREELLTMGVVDIEAVIPDNFSWEKHVEEVRSKGFLLMEGNHKRKDGTTFPVEVNVKMISPGGKEYMVAVIRDITDRKVNESRLKEQNLELERLNKAMTGRELKMIEMKAELEKLRQQRGEKN